MSDPQYATLRAVLDAAYAQAAHGKGKERHANSKAFERQPMQTISELIESDGGLYYQAIKKIREAKRMEHAARERELLGAINYIAGIIIFNERQAIEMASKERIVDGELRHL